MALFLGCQEPVAEIPEEFYQPASQQIKVEAFDSLLNRNHVKGSILIYDLNKDQYLSNDFAWARVGRLPASTYKIPNSIIALESGVVKDDSTLFEWDGQPRGMNIWEQDLIFKDAFQYSCVPCYQEVAREVGAERMNEYLVKLEYSGMDVSQDNIGQFWLQGDSKISQYQQVDFLKRLFHSELPIQPRTEEIVKRMMLIDSNEHYELRGKTGWALREDYNHAWFVGYVTRGEDVYFFATNIEPIGKMDSSIFPTLPSMKFNWNPFKKKKTEYKFNEPENTTCMVSADVINGSEPILLATRNSSGDWFFSSGKKDRPDGTSQPMTLKQVTELDQSVNALHAMPLNVGARRDGHLSKWVPFKI